MKVALLTLTLVTVILVAADKNCYNKARSKLDYTGTLSKTRSGHICQRWDATTPHRPNKNAQTDAHYPEGSVSGANNYCRNPDGSSSPWCYTVEKSKRWEYCAVPKCSDVTVPPVPTIPPTVAPTTAEAKKCPTDFVEINSNCYLFSKKKAEQASAAAACSKLGSSLLSLESDKENKAVKTYLSKQPDWKSPFWFSLKKTSTIKTASWVWSDGSSIGFTDWCTDKKIHKDCDEPDGTKHNLCVFYKYKFGYQWADYSCNSKRRFICKQKVATDKTTCPKHFVRITGTAGTNCYFFGKKQQTQATAVKSCANFGSGTSLLRLESKAENDAVKTHLKKNEKWGYWFSLKKKDIWTWGDGSAAGFTDWCTDKKIHKGCDEPDGNGGCAFYSHTFKGHWADYKCSHKARYICKLEKESCYTGTGTAYAGKVSTTSSGKTCQSWTSQSPQSHKYSKLADKYPDNSVAEAANHCRNPSGYSKGPWCYTTDASKRWEPCAVTKC